MPLGGFESSSGGTSAGAVTVELRAKTDQFDAAIGKSTDIFKKTEQAANENVARIGEASGHIGRLLAESLVDFERFERGATRALVNLSEATLRAMPVAGTAVVIASGIAVAAYERWIGAQDRLQRSLNGIGAGSGYTVGGLSAAATAASQAGNITSGQARDVAAQLAGTGRIGPEILPQILGASKQFSIATNQTLTEGGADLAKAFADPAKGAELLQQKLGPLNAATLELIRSQEAAGDRLGAQTTLLDAFRDRIQAATDTSGIFRRVWEGIKQDFDDRADAFGKLLSGPTLEEQLAAVQARLKAGPAALDPRAFDGASGFVIGSPVDEAKHKADLEEEAKLTGQIAANNAKAAASAKEAEITDQSKLGRAAVLGALPDIEARQKAVDAANAIARAGQNVAPLGVSDADAGRALSAYQHVQDTMLTSLQKQRQEGELILRGFLAETLGEKAAVAAERERLSLAGQRITIGEAQLRIDQASARVIAEANKAADDALHEATNRYNLVGLRPTQRALAEIEQQRQDALEKGSLDGASVTPSSARQAIKNIESRGSGGYGALGPLQPSGDRAIGAYGVMASNVPSWTKAALGRSMTPEEFRLDQSAQDRTFDNRFGGYLDKYGPAGAASTWFTGHPDIRNVSDSVGTTNAGYVSRFMRDYGGGSASAAAGPNGKIGSRYDTDQAAILKGAALGPLQASTDAIMAQERALTAQISTFGKSAAAIAEENERQKLYSQYAREGTEVTKEIAAGIDVAAKAAGNYAQHLDAATKSEQQLVGAMDTVRAGASSFLGTAISDLEHGKKASDAFKDGLKSLADIATKKLESGLIDSLFGKQGTPGGGVFGDALGGLFKSATGSAGGSSGGIFGSLAGLFGSGASAAGGAAASTAASSATSLGSTVSSLVAGLGLASGTDDWKGGPTWVGETGPEILNLPRGAAITPNLSIPKMPNIASSGPSSITHNVAISVDVSGANGDAAIKQIAGQAAATAAHAAYRQAIADTPGTLARTSLRMHG